MIKTMNETEKKIEALKSCIGKTDEESRRIFTESIAYLKANDSEDVQRTLSEIIKEGLRNTKKEIEVLKTQIEDVYDILPLSYIAKRYFNKSRAWLYQRLNGYKVKGKTYTLNEEEKRIFNAAMQELSAKIGSVQLS